MVKKNLGWCQLCGVLRSIDELVLVFVWEKKLLPACDNCCKRRDVYLVFQDEKNTLHYKVSKRLPRAIDESIVTFGEYSFFTKRFEEEFGLPPEIEFKPLVILTEGELRIGKQGKQ